MGDPSSQLKSTFSTLVIEVVSGRELNEGRGEDGYKEKGEL